MVDIVEATNDIRKIIKCFDGFMDNMYNRGCFDIDNIKEDKEINDYIEQMKQKYHVK